MGRLDHKGRYWLSWYEKAWVLRFALRLGKPVSELPIHKKDGFDTEWDSFFKGSGGEVFIGAGLQTALNHQYQRYIERPCGGHQGGNPYPTIGCVCRLCLEVVIHLTAKKVYEDVGLTWRWDGDSERALKGLPPLTPEEIIELRKRYGTTTGRTSSKDPNLNAERNANREYWAKVVDRVSAHIGKIQTEDVRPKGEPISGTRYDPDLTLRKYSQGDAAHLVKVLDQTVKSDLKNPCAEVYLDDRSVGSPCIRPRKSWVEKELERYGQPLASPIHPHEAEATNLVFGEILLRVISAGLAPLLRPVMGRKNFFYPHPKLRAAIETFLGRSLPTELEMEAEPRPELHLNIGKGAPMSLSKYLKRQRLLEPEPKKLQTTTWDPGYGDD